MTLSPQLLQLGQYLAGEFENAEQALAYPAWYVNLRLWQRPVPLFTDDSICLYAEQANVLKLDQPYRPRLFRLRSRPEAPDSLQIAYYKFKNIESVRGAGTNPALLQQITPDWIEFLPGCTLDIQTEPISAAQFRFRTHCDPERPCCFTHDNQQYQIFLGFEVTPQILHVYDRGINPETGQAIWGALLGPFIFQKRRDFATEIIT
ncbi:MAG: chromophore lyase CpcT/CpeT [Jaaginema sp. PMC 1079.18]|nr:chromophore lyase CpcT/CpeT [Jaaginema sp. PMC 1080.18]MEC4851912.1 chromophore lyase CpcT/CpeT [Jaaginema sp. PMC 1079.18]MEC4867462.1 chromophore lyase CpcT/CpeT [Jaaginema sp. PMC 1078.18]